MNKTERWDTDVMAQYQRGKIKVDARTAELTANREAVIKLRIDDFRAKLDAILKPGRPV